MATPTERSAVEGTVTLLFTDIVGSTELLSRIGDEAAETVRRADFRLLRDAVLHRGGHEVKNLGDGLMVAFPSAADAVRCAIEMQQAMTRHNLRAGEIALAVRVGLHVGEPVRDEDDYFGTPVVVAQRLCDSASGGQIIASHLVRALVGAESNFEFGELTPFALKGLGEPVSACSVAWAPMPGPVAVPTALLGDEQAAFVDRTEERARLLDLWRRARDGARQLAFIVGEPGIGKTRLAAEVAKAAAGQGVVLYGHSDEETLVPYQPFVEAIRPYVMSVPVETLSGELALEAAQLARLLPELAERLVMAASTEPTDDPATERYRLFEAMTIILDHAASAAPVLLVLDDLQWADKPTVLLLRHLVRSPRPQRIFLLGTYRDAEVGPDRPLGAALADLRRDHRYDRVRLHGLGADDVTALTGEWGDVELARTVGRAIYDETEGNPFFVSETLRHLAETGAIRQEDGRWVADVAAAELAIPEGVREVVTRRLARLPDAARRILAVAAVMGPEFELRPLAAVVELDEVVVLDALEAGVTAQVILEAPEAVDRYVFSHALIRRTLFEEMSTTRRVRLHRRIGDALESSTDVTTDRLLGQLAYHYGEAAVAGEGEKAVKYAMSAGARAVELVAYEEAVDHFQAALQAIELGVPDAARDLDRRSQRGPARARRRRVADGRPRRRGARRSARWRSRPARRAAPITWRGPRSVMAAGSAATARPCGRTPRSSASSRKRSPPSARSAPPCACGCSAAWRPSCTTRRSSTAGPHSPTRRSTSPGRSATRCCSVSRSDSREAALWGPDRPPADRLAACDEIVALSQGSRERYMDLEARSLRIDALMVLGDIAAADQEHEARSREAEALRMPQYLAEVVAYPAARAILTGDFEQAQRLADRSVEVAEPGASETAMTLFGAEIICMHWLKGQLDGLVPLITDFADRYPWIPAFRATEVFMLAETGQLDAAREGMERLWESHFATIPRDGIWKIAMWALGGTAVIFEERMWAGALYDLLLPVSDCAISIGASMYLGPATTTLGMLATVLERLDEGADHFEEALEQASRAGRGRSSPSRSTGMRSCSRSATVLATALTRRRCATRPVGSRSSSAWSRSAPGSPRALERETTPSSPFGRSLPNFSGPFRQSQHSGSACPCGPAPPSCCNLTHNFLPAAHYIPWLAPPAGVAPRCSVVTCHHFAAAAL